MRKISGFSESDPELLWQAVTDMFGLGRSAGRGKMAVREPIIFRHDAELGTVPAATEASRLFCRKRDDFC